MLCGVLAHLKAVRHRDYDASPQRGRFHSVIAIDEMRLRCADSPNKHL